MKIQHEFFIFYALLLLITNLSISKSHKCTYGTKNRVKTKNLVKLDSHLDDWKPIRIHLDYSSIEGNITNYSKEHFIFLKEKVLPKTIEILKSILKVRPINYVNKIDVIGFLKFKTYTKSL